MLGTCAKFRIDKSGAAAIVAKIDPWSYRGVSVQAAQSAGNSTLSGLNALLRVSSVSDSVPSMSKIIALNIITMNNIRKVEI
jgi:hypothetical protein